MTPASLYRRTLPDGLVPFASEEGRVLFREALATGGMEGFFALSEQFHTQADPSYCGLGSLVMVLNALAIDPGRLWKGPWRWFSEELLDCCKPLERVRETGISLDELACLAHCNGAWARVERSSVRELRANIREAAAAPREPIVVVSYDRAVLGQTGGGHFSPVGGYHADRDLVLLLDVARFKYPPHWVSLERLHAAMQSLDPSTGQPRGWAVLSSRAATGPAAPLVFAVAVACGVDALAVAIESSLPNALRTTGDVPTSLERFASTLDGIGVSVLAKEATAPPHVALAATVRAELGSTETLRHLGSSESLAVLALAAPLAIWTGTSGAEVVAMLARDLASRPTLAAEVERISVQLVALSRLGAKRCCD